MRGTSALAVHLAHLARRWRATVKHSTPKRSKSLGATSLSENDLAWVRSLLSEAELALWQRFGYADKAHSIAVARQVERQVEQPNQQHRIACVAGLLHDIGKITAPQSASARVVAALMKPLVPRSVLQRWERQFIKPTQPTQTGKLAALKRLLVYPACGAALLTEAQSHPTVIAWAAEHHLAPEHWSINQQLGTHLQQADQNAI